MTPRERATRLSAAEVRAAWFRATIGGRVEPFAKDASLVDGRKATAYEVLYTPVYAREPHDAASHEAATKAAHELGFALEDVRRLTVGPPPV